MSRKKAIPSKPSPSNARRARERLSSSLLEELWSIWRADARVPSIKSRRLWAISRNANPRLVDSWFLRRKTCAKKMGQPVPDGSYDLPLDLPIAPKREPSPTPIEPELEATPDLPSDDTLVYPSDGDYLNNLEVSSDTVFDVDDVHTDLENAGIAAYKEVPQRSCHKNPQFQPEWSSADIYAPNHSRSVDTSFEDPPLVCNQGKGKESDFTCVLCSTEPTQDEDQSDLAPATAYWSEIPNPYVDFFPETLWELSAIPFLFRTPPAVYLDDAAHRQNVDDWSIVEEELGRLVTDGKLDFSFFDDNLDLVSMELSD